MNIDFRLATYVDPQFFWFTILGILFGIFYSSMAGKNLGWNPDYGWKHTLWDIKNFKTPQKENKPELIPVMIDRRDIFKDDDQKPPKSWHIEIRVQNFISVLIGWWILWFLLDVRLNAFDGFKNMRFEWWDGATFIIAYIGINGRLPTIAHSVQEWLKR